MSAVDEYLRAERKAARARGVNRKNVMRARARRLWDRLTEAEKAEAVKRWRDPS